MHIELTKGIDVALLVFYAFVLFFICLIFYLRREDRREGYPVEDGMTGRVEKRGGPLSRATEKTFRLPHGRGTVTTPTGGRDRFDLAARPFARFHGAPLVPTGDPLADGIGPAGWAERADHPDLDMEGRPRIVPLSSDSEFWVASRDPSLQGWPVVGADGGVAGTVSDLWIDRADRLIRYLSVTTDSGAVPVPMMMAKVDRRRRRVVVDALRADQFAAAPRPKGDGTITLYEEERTVAYFGGGYLYALPGRAGPVL